MNLMNTWVEIRNIALIIAIIMLFLTASKGHALFHPIEIEIAPIEEEDNRPRDEDGNPLS